MTGMHHHTQLFWMRWGFMNFLPGLIQTHHLPNLSLPAQLG
jgi:hypothetical protein